MIILEWPHWIGMVPLAWNGPIGYKRNLKKCSLVVLNFLALCFPNDTKLFAFFLPNPTPLCISSLTPITVLNQTGKSDRKKKEIILALDSEAS